MGSRVLRLPSYGRLIVCGDLHGNLRDYNQIKTIFLRARNEDPAVNLLFLGDLIHGPNIPHERWSSDKMGDYFEDKSTELLEDYIQLKEDFPFNVFCLLGNHEHSHIGGPITRKFYNNEPRQLEKQLSHAQVEQTRSLFTNFPLIAVGLNGLVFTHAAPSRSFSSLDALEEISYEGYENFNQTQMENAGFIGEILWKRSASPIEAQEFLRKTVLPEGTSNHVCIYGHDIIWDGFRFRGREQLCLSTSFGLLDTNKVYLDLDLAKPYFTVQDIRMGMEIQSLWPL